MTELCLHCSRMGLRLVAETGSDCRVRRSSLVGRRGLGGWCCCCRGRAGCMMLVGCIGLAGRGSRRLAVGLANDDRMAAVAAVRILRLRRIRAIGSVREGLGGIRLVGHMVDRIGLGCSRARIR